MFLFLLFHRVDSGGDNFTRSLFCTLPMNFLLRWTYLLWWWTSILVSSVMILHQIYFTVNLFCPCFRTSSYRGFVSRACRGDLIALKIYKHQLQLKYHKRYIIIHLSYTDWIKLYFLQVNLGEIRFPNFIRKLVNTSNNVIYLKTKQDLLTDITAHEPETRMQDIAPAAMESEVTSVI